MIGEHAARGEDGKAYYFPADMTYKEWQKAFVEGDKTGFSAYDRDGLKHFRKNDKVNFMDRTKEWVNAQRKKGLLIQRQEYTVDVDLY